MLRCLAFIAVLFAPLVIWSGPASAERHAFVVGIDRYDNLGPRGQLQRAFADATGVARRLEQLGFQTALHRDLTRREFNTAWQQFIDGVLPGDQVALFFAGHGIEIDQQNYLLPRDIPNIAYGRQARLKRESLSLPELLADLRARKPQVTLVILDACREHPLVPPEYRSLGGRGGLAPILAPQGTFIMYSAGAGETALDRLPTETGDGNSIYTRKLLPLLATPGLTIQDVAQRVRTKVFQLAKTVQHTQRPAYYDGLIGQFCLAGCEPDETVPAGPAVATATSVSPSRQQTAVRAARPSTPSTEERAACTSLPSRLSEPVPLKPGAKICSASGDDFAEVVRIANRAIAFRVNGIQEFTCRVGDICQFNWRRSPLFSVRAKVDRARGIAPNGALVPR